MAGHVTEVIMKNNSITICLLVSAGIPLKMASKEGNMCPPAIES